MKEVVEESYREEIKGGGFTSIVLVSIHMEYFLAIDGQETG
jgi:hypothetical protein